VIDVNVSGDDPSRTVEAGLKLDSDVAGDTEQELIDNNPILHVMCKLARDYGVSVTLSVYPPGVEDDNDADDEPTGEPCG
jgi:hypothetical protein